MHLHKAILIFSLSILLILWGGRTYGQTFQAESEEITMKFGFPELKIMDDLLYEDENQNKQLDVDEACLISFSVQNVGKYTAKDVAIRPEELNGIKGLDLPKKVAVGEIKPGETKSVQIGMTSTDSLQAGTASLVFYILEKGEERNLSVVYALGTAGKGEEMKEEEELEKEGENEGDN